LLTFLLELLQRSREFLPPQLEFTQGEDVSELWICYVL
jgi:hypothetical protein